jgi:hypothetical protein
MKTNYLNLSIVTEKISVQVDIFHSQDMECLEVPALPRRRVEKLKLLWGRN